ncbi:MFS transporter [Trinickia dabaoshanensis]|uniref:MFS transporter n=1 Tax=Trinickia dabaoshanensis TaxID=564714 RepID=A0A2N7VUM0_9BURK|nr:MFS transporter [Trinickia dabaoshanensis]PMS20841.1 MFS transporter [Trinickia dabaoshanensis]
MNSSLHDIDVVPPRATRAGEKRLILGAVCLAGLSMPLSFTGPALALPAIAGVLGGSPLALAWVTNAFMLAFGSCLLVAGTLADRYGRKRVFLCGTLAFALSSMLAALAPSLIAVDLARAAQGIGGAAALSAGAAALAQEFEGDARTRAFSLLGTTFGVGLAFGPVVAGALVAHFGWRSVFAMVTVVTTIASGLGAKCMRETRDPLASSVDWLGAATFTCSLALFTYAVLRVPDAGWTSRPVLSLLAASAVAGAAFVIVELRSTRPMLELTLLRYPRFVGVQFLAAAPAYSYVVLLVLLPVRLIGIEGFDSVAAGRMMFALSAPMLVVPLLAARLARTIAPGVIAGLGLLLCACGQLWLAQCAPGQPVGNLLLAMAVIGTGVGLPWGLMDALAVSVVPKERAGMAAGIFNTTRVAGEGIALAVVAALLASLTESNLRGASPRAASDAALAHAANRLAMGDVPAAVAWMHGVASRDLIHFYGLAFHSLLHVLAAVTVLSALLVFGFLGRTAVHEDQERTKSQMSACN